MKQVNRLTHKEAMTGEYANNFTFFYAPKVVTQSCNPVIDFATNRDELGPV